MPTDPPRNPPTVPVPSSGVQGVPGVQPVPVGRNQQGRVAGVPPPGQQARGYPQHTPLPYGQPVPPYGHSITQAGRAAPQPVPRGYYANPSSYQSGFAPNMNYGTNPQQSAHYRLPQNQVYQVPYPYSGYVAPGAPTAQPPPGSNALQGRDYSQQVPRRSVPPNRQHRKSKAIPIINPTTNEEVQISKTDPKPAQDPAQGSTAQTKPASKAPDPVVPRPIQPTSKVSVELVPAAKVNVTPVKPEESATKKSEESATEKSEELKDATPPGPNVTPTPVQVSKVPEKTTSPVTPAIPDNLPPKVTPVVDASAAELKNTQELKEVEKVPEGVETTNFESSVPPVTAAEKVIPEVAVSSASSEPATSVKESKLVEPSVTKVANDEAIVNGRTESESKAPEASRLSSSGSSVTTAEKSLEELTPPGPAKRERPPSPKFAEGDRRVYAPEWILQMREYMNKAKSAEFNALLLKANISKSNPGNSNPRGGDRKGRSGGGGGGAGVLSDDPRRRMAPPPGGHFSMPPRNSGPFGSAGGGYDAFDMGLARRQAPPPISGGGGSGGGRDDPRGRRTQGSNRFDGPNRFGVGPLDPMIHAPPAEKLKKSEKGWKRNKEADDEVTSKVKQVRSLLNKLTLEKFDKIFSQIIAIDLSSVEILRGVVDEVFEKTLFEPKFSSMYAELCKRLDTSTKEMLQKANFPDAKGKPLTFRKILLKNCQDEFTRFSNAGSEGLQETNEEVNEEEADKSQELSQEEKEKMDKLKKEEQVLAASRAKRRMLANVRFIGELYIKDLISESIIHKSCVQPLLRLGISKKEEDVLEALCKLLASTGMKLSANPKAKSFVDGYFEPLGKMSRDHTLPARVRFMIQDLLEQRANNWKARREEAGAKKISEIHKDIEKEERAKAEAQAAARDRRGRGGGGGGHRDRNRFSAPVMQMTMAPSRHGSGGGMSRSSAQLEKIANRGAASNMERFANRGANMPNVRLGPGGGGGRGGVGANGWKSMSGGRISSRGAGAGAGGASEGASLRPRSRNAFAALDTDNKEGPVVSSGDVRRGNRFNTGALGGAGSQSVKQTPAQPPVPKMSDADVKRKAKSIVSEYWSIRSLTEAKECIIDEVKTPNYTKFIEMAVRFSIDGKVDQRALSVPLFCGLLAEGVLSAEIIVDAFTAVIADLDNMEMDNPRASESIALYLGTLAATGKLGSGEDAGLFFLTSALEKVEMPKRVVKLIVLTLHQYEIAISEAEKDEGSRKAKVVGVFKSLNVDLVGKIMDFNPMRGMSVLEDLLNDNKVAFILPMLPVEKKVSEMIAAGKSGREMFDAVKSLGMSSEDMQGTVFATLVVRLALSHLFLESTLELSKKFSEGAGKLLVLCNDGKSPTASVQMDVVLEVQVLLHKKEAEFASLAGEYVGKKYGYAAFDALYESDVVVESVFLAWKGDTEVSMKVDGKPELLLQSSAFFKWLAEAESE